MNVGSLKNAVDDWHCFTARDWQRNYDEPYLRLGIVELKEIFLATNGKQKLNLPSESRRTKHE